MKDDVPTEELADVLFAAWEGSLIRIQAAGAVAPVQSCLNTLVDAVFHP